MPSDPSAFLSLWARTVAPSVELHDCGRENGSTDYKIRSRLGNGVRAPGQENSGASCKMLVNRHHKWKEKLLKNKCWPGDLGCRYLRACRDQKPGSRSDAGRTLRE